MDRYEYRVKVVVSGFDVWSTAEMMAQKFNEGYFGLDLSGTVSTEQMVNALQAWLPGYLENKVEQIMNDLDYEIGNCSSYVSAPFFKMVKEAAGLAHRVFHMEYEGDGWIVARTVFIPHRPGEPGDILYLYPYLGVFEEEEDCAQMAHQWDKAVEAAHTADEVRMFLAENPVDGPLHGQENPFYEEMDTERPQDLSTPDVGSPGNEVDE